MDNIDPRPPTAILVVCSLFGFFGNSNIIIATWRKNSLRSTCNYLIAIASFLDIMHQISQLTLAYFVFVSDGVPSLETCFKVQAIPMLCVSMAQMMMFLISLDRLASVGKPIWYKLVRQTYEITIFLFLAFSFGIYLNYKAFIDLQPIKHNSTLCNIVSSFTGDSQLLFFGSNAIINMLTLIMYTAIWMVVKTSTTKRLNSMVRSICAVTVLGIGGWSVTLFILASLTAMNIPFSEEFVLYAGIPCNVSQALSYPIYFVMSNQYRQAFSEQLYILTRRRLLSSTIHSSTHMNSGQLNTKPDMTSTSGRS